jgi:hypothetical protein
VSNWQDTRKLMKKQDKQAHKKGKLCRGIVILETTYAWHFPGSSSIVLNTM